MKATIVLALCFAAGCYKSHSRMIPFDRDDGSTYRSEEGGFYITDVRTGEATVEDTFVPEVLLEGVFNPTLVATSMAGNSAPVPQDAPEDGSGSASDRAPEPGEGDPILFEVIQDFGCINRDSWIDIIGTGIHWEATVTISYPFSESWTTVTRDQVDGCNQPFVNWVDTDQIEFRTRSDLQWNGMSRFVTGNYLVHVTNPDGSSSNAIGLYLQWCGADEGGPAVACDG